MDLLKKCIALCRRVRYQYGHLIRLVCRGVVFRLCICYPPYLLRVFVAVYTHKSIPPHGIWGSVCLACAPLHPNPLRRVWQIRSICAPAPSFFVEQPCLLQSFIDACSLDWLLSIVVMHFAFQTFFVIHMDLVVRCAKAPRWSFARLATNIQTLGGLQPVTHIGISELL